MQQALQYRDWLSTAASGGPPPEKTETVKKVVAENAVVVVARKGCFMCHVVKLLLHGHGVNPTIVIIDEENEDEVTTELTEMIGAKTSENTAAVSPPFPAVFVGGELVGGLKEVMGAHISGELVPRLRQARALWL